MPDLDPQQNPQQSQQPQGGPQINPEDFQEPVMFDHPEDDRNIAEKAEDAYDDVKDTMDRGKELYNKLTGKGTGGANNAAKYAADAGAGAAGAKMAEKLAKNPNDLSKGAQGPSGISKPPAPGENLGKNIGKDVGKNVGKEAVKDVGKAAAKGAAKAAATAGTEAAAGAATGGIGAVALMAADYVNEHKKEIGKGCFWVVAFITVMSMLIFGGACAFSLSGGRGKTYKQKTTADSQVIKDLVKAASTNTVTKTIPVGEWDKMPQNEKKEWKIVATNYDPAHLALSYTIEKTVPPVLNFGDEKDLQYIKDGKIDKRLATSLLYLTQKHSYIHISHIVSAYDQMSVNPESGAFHDTQITKNVSAHKDGLALDIDQIDKIPEKCECGELIPVRVGWQAIGTEVFPSAPPVLDQVQSAEDLLKPEVQSALEEMGVVYPPTTPELPEQVKAVPMSGIEDIIKPEVNEQLVRIGFSGIDEDSKLIIALKRIKALEQLNDLKITDLDSLLEHPDLTAQIGVNLTPEVVDSIKKIQQAQVLTNIHSLADLQNPEIIAALQGVGIDASDEDFQKALKQMLAAQTVSNWQGDLNDPDLLQALNDLGLSPDNSLMMALTMLQSSQVILNIPPGTVISDPEVVLNYKLIGIDLTNPEIQNLMKIYSAAAQIQNWDGHVNAANLSAVLTTLNLPNTQEFQTLLNQYQSAQFVINYDGPLDDPLLLGKLEALGLPTINLDQDKLLEWKKQGTIGLMTTVVHVTIPEGVQAAWQTLQDVDSLLSIHSLDDFSKPAVQQALNNLHIPTISANTGNTLMLYGSLYELTKIDSMSDLSSPAVKNALANLHVSPDVAEGLGKLGSIDTLAHISSPFDLLKPDVQNALETLNIPLNDDFKKVLGQAGSVATLLQVDSPSDLLQPQVLQAMDNLGIINVDSKLLGQIGAIQTLMNIDSIGDLLNPSSLLALDTLGLISLGPVGAVLMAVNFISSILGIDLGGFFDSIFGGGCDKTTACYGPVAQANVHKVVTELLDFPKDEAWFNAQNIKPDWQNYRVTQLITFSQELDVDPFWDKLNDLYGLPRQANYGLFAMPEANDHLHIGY